MAIILNIDTALETASVCLSRDGEVLEMLKNDRQKDHAAWLHGAVAQMMERQGLAMRDLSAVAVSIGPGSYTGLRVGLSTAKGFCYALKIPLIGVNTLEMIASAAAGDAVDLICPMIDARRMEVFMAVYNRELEEIRKPAAVILHPQSFDDLLANHHLTFCGSGSNKLQAIFEHPKARFSAAVADASQLSVIASIHYQRGLFADLAYTEPLYLKEFHSTRLPSL